MKPLEQHVVCNTALMCDTLAQVTLSDHYIYNTKHYSKFGHYYIYVGVYLRATRPGYQYH
jgi:hypothetical protein